MEDIQYSNQKSKRSAQKTNLIASGRIPPQAIDLEEAVLGALLIDKNALANIIDILHPDAFYKNQHKNIFKIITILFGNNQPIDILTVATELRKEGLMKISGGEAYLAQLSQKVSSAAHIEYHARIILQKHIQRELVRISSEIIESAFDETTDVLELLDNAEQKLFEVGQGNLKRNYESAEVLIRQAIDKIENISKQEGLSGIPSGFSELDRVTSGWQPSDLIILAARPGMGKTAFVLSMARNMAVDHHKKVAVFSLEMSSIQLITRIISSETGLSSEKLRKGDLTDREWNELTSGVKELEKTNLFIDDTPALSVFDLRAKVRRLKSTQGLDLIIIDYLQLMTVGGSKTLGNREQEISTISRSLKSIAKELTVPVIALSQLSRAVETRSASKRPQLSDLRESGAIEQDADIVSFIYRPEYYSISEWEDGDPSDNQAEIIIAKHRNGSLEDVRLRFIAELAKFSDLDHGSRMILESKMNVGEDSKTTNDGYTNITPQELEGGDVPF
ncbi:MAG: replicative DNA helicase [Bacteroidota bacterium]|nr:replicative DNA helicase [Bacteroidota bacterium]